MCLIIKRGYKNSRKAEKNIRVYKVVELHRGLIISYYTQFVYELGKIYRTHFSYDSAWKVQQGFHAYVSIQDTRAYQRTNYAGYTRIVSCIIPKGTLYHLGERSDIVAEAIKIERVLLDEPF